MSSSMQSVASLFLNREERAWKPLQHEVEAVALGLNVSSGGGEISPYLLEDIDVSSGFADLTTVDAQFPMPCHNSLHFSVVEAI